MSGVPGSESHPRQALVIIVMVPPGSPVIKFQANHAGSQRKGIFFRVSVLSALTTRSPAVSVSLLSSVHSHEILGLIECFSNPSLQGLLSRWRISEITPLPIIILCPGRKVKGLDSGSVLKFPL